MWWAAAIQVGLSVFGAMKSSGAAGQARNIGTMNQEAQRLETRESIRRQDMLDKEQVGLARAYAGASGFSIQPGTSQAGYIDAMISEQRRQRDFTIDSSRRKEKILGMGGQAAYSQAQASMFGSLATAAGQFGNMWSSPDAPWNA